MTLATELFAIRDAVGELTPQVVVQAARDNPESYPDVYDGLEWNDAIGGETNRCRQAANMIRSVRITFVRPNGETSSVRQFHAVMQPDRAQHVYEPVEDIANDPLYRRMLLGQLERDWMAFKAKYQHLAEFMDIINREAGAA